MSQTLEIVLFRAHSDREDLLLSRRTAAMAALRERCPGMVSARLGRLDDGRWIDTVVWESRRHALAAADTVMSIPAFASWCEGIAEVLSTEHASLIPEPSQP